MKRFISLYIAMILFASCEQPVEYRDRIVEKEVDRIVEVEVEKEVIVEVEKTVVEEKEVLVDNVIQTTKIEYVEKEIYIMSEVEIPAVEPIQEYDNYVSLESGYGNRVFGVTTDGFEEIPNIKDLFRIDGALFFKIDEKLYCQENGVITEIEESDLPTVPESEHITFENSIYKIQQYVYKDVLTSRVYKHVSETMNPVTAYLQVDGACMRGNDLLYSVSEEFPNRPKGIYIWTVKGNPIRLFESGRIW